MIIQRKNNRLNFSIIFMKSNKRDILTGEKETMTVNEVPYPVNGKKKDSVFENGKE